MLSNTDFKSLLASNELTSSSGKQRFDLKQISQWDRENSQQHKKHFGKAAKDSFEPRAEKDDSNSSKYRDRAKERRTDIKSQESELEEQALKLSVDQTKFLGGDFEHTHLVKGLDYALLRKSRECETIQLISESHTIERGKCATSTLLGKNLAKVLFPQKFDPRNTPLATTAAGIIFDFDTNPESDLELPVIITKSKHDALDQQEGYVCYDATTSDLISKLSIAVQKAASKLTGHKQHKSTKKGTVEGPVPSQSRVIAKPTAVASTDKVIGDIYGDDILDEAVGAYVPVGALDGVEKAQLITDAIATANASANAASSSASTAFPTAKPAAVSKQDTHNISRHGHTDSVQDLIEDMDDDTVTVTRDTNNKTTASSSSSSSVTVNKEVVNKEVVNKEVVNKEVVNKVVVNKEVVNKEVVNKVVAACVFDDDEDDEGDDVSAHPAASNSSSSSSSMMAPVRPFMSSSGSGSGSGSGALHGQVKAKSAYELQQQFMMTDVDIERAAPSSSAAKKPVLSSSSSSSSSRQGAAAAGSEGRAQQLVHRSVFDVEDSAGAGAQSQKKREGEAMWQGTYEAHMDSSMGSKYSGIVDSDDEDDEGGAGGGGGGGSSRTKKRPTGNTSQAQAEGGEGEKTVKKKKGGLDYNKNAGGPNRATRRAMARGEL